jgi:hypothetical protein
VRHSLFGVYKKGVYVYCLMYHVLNIGVERGTADLEVLLSRSLLVAVPRRVHTSVDDVRVRVADSVEMLAI